MAHTGMPAPTAMPTIDAIAIEPHSGLFHLKKVWVSNLINNTVGDPSLHLKMILLTDFTELTDFR